MIYIYLFLFPIFIGKIEQFHKKNRYLYICFFQLFLFWILRGECVGKDTSSYLQLLDDMKNNIDVDFELSHYEVGFKLLYKTLSDTIMSSRALLVVCGAIIMIGFAVFIYKNIKTYEMATVLFTALIFPASLNIMRQIVAVAISINFIQFLRKDKYIIAIALIILGSLFHSSVLLFLLIVFCYAIGRPKFISYIASILSIFCFVFIDKLMLLTKLIGGKISYYFDATYSVSRIFRTTSFVVLLEFILIISAYLRFCERRCYSKKIDINDILSESRLMSICIYAICGNLFFAILYLRNEAISRVMYNLDVFLLASLPLSCNFVNKKNNQLLKFIILGASFMLMLNSVYNSGNGIENYVLCFWN